MKERKRRIVATIIIALIGLVGMWWQQKQNQPPPPVINGTATSTVPAQIETETNLAGNILETLPVKGRAPKTGYKRSQFGEGWINQGGCDTRNIILGRDLTHTVYRSATDCTVMSGILEYDPYTGRSITFARGADSSPAIQIDHVVALSDAWQKGAQQLAFAQRQQLANDPLELLAVDGPTNNNKGDGDAATWLPPNVDYRCRYVARQIAVKKKYSLWVTSTERDAMRRILATCPEQLLPEVNAPASKQ